MLYADFENIFKPVYEQYRQNHNANEDQDKSNANEDQEER